MNAGFVIGPFSHWELIRHSGFGFLILAVAHPRFPGPEAGFSPVRSTPLPRITGREANRFSAKENGESFRKMRVFEQTCHLEGVSHV